MRITLTERLSAAFAAFRKPALVRPVVGMMVRPLATDDTLEKNLIIDQDRANALHRAAKKAYYAHEDLAVGLQEASAQCSHPNELAYCAFLIGGELVTNQLRCTTAKTQ